MKSSVVPSPVMEKMQESDHALLDSVDSPEMIKLNPLQGNGPLFDHATMDISDKVNSITSYYAQLKSPYLSSRILIRQRLQHENTRLHSFEADILRQAGQMPAANGYFRKLTSLFGQVTRKQPENTPAVHGDEAAASVYQLKDKAKACREEIDELESGLKWCASKIKSLDEEMALRIGSLSVGNF